MISCCAGKFLSWNQRSAQSKAEREEKSGLSLPKFTVRTWSVRDRLTLLLKKYKEKMRNEERGSGIKCDEETELKMALSEIIEKEQVADLERKENANTLTKKNENDKVSAEESRLKALERLGQTKKRNADSCDEVINPKTEEVPLKLCKF